LVHTDTYTEKSRTTREGTVMGSSYAALRMSSMKPLALFVLGAAALIFTVPAMAAENTDVARVSAIAKGSMTIQRGDDQEQLAATVNAPLLPGDFIATAPGTQAEIQLDGFTTLRLGGAVQARIVNNDSTTREVQVAAGTVVLGIAHPENGDIAIDTPSVTLRASQVGGYRLTVSSDGATLATARSGQAEVVSPKSTVSLTPGNTIVITGDASNPTIETTSEVARDALDEFSKSRARIANSALDTDSYVPENIAGYDDLNAYGKWIDVRPYGMVWNPYEPADWVPYRYGSWAWADGFGWTWIANEPWGWTPYHYGRWFACAPYGWCWYPPTVGLAPVWYPGLVGFFGFGDYWGATLGFQYWGWVPLAPWEPYYPWYPGWGAWHTHPTPPPVRHNPHPIPVKITHRPLVPVRTRPEYGVNVENTYKNIRGGATGVSGTGFRSGNFGKPVAIDPRRLKNVTLMQGGLPLTPTTNNLRFTQTPPKTTVRWAPVFKGPRFATANGLPRRTQFPSQRQQLQQTLHNQSHAIVSAKPQQPPASQAWQHFENSRRDVTLPPSTMPHPYRYPVTNPVRWEPHPDGPVSQPPVTKPMPPASRPPVYSAPPTHRRPPSNGVQHADWQKAWVLNDLLTGSS
jgi:hypothetical protein